MFIRKTKIKSGPQDESYYLYRLVETSRTRTGVKQHMLLNLGKYFNIEPIHWPLLAKRIDELVNAINGSLNMRSVFIQQYY